MQILSLILTAIVSAFGTLSAIVAHVMQANTEPLGWNPSAPVRHLIVLGVGALATVSAAVVPNATSLTGF
jgi:hypothetical protein